MGGYGREGDCGCGRGGLSRVWVGGNWGGDVTVVDGSHEGAGGYWG